jgi:hypothetical protein
VLQYQSDHLLVYLKPLIPCRFYKAAKKLAYQASKFLDEGEPGKFKPNKKLLNDTWKGSSAKELLCSEITILEGMTEKAAQALKSLQCGTVEKLAGHSYCHWAEAIVALAPLDEQHAIISKIKKKDEKKDRGV